MIKYASNSVLATLISFSNEIGEPVHRARRRRHRRRDARRAPGALLHHARCRTASASRPPITSFLWAGCGFGGSCLPKDTKALSAHGGRARPADAAAGCGHSRPTWRSPRAWSDCWKSISMQLSGKRVALLGLAFKPDTDDMRESPSIGLAKLLIDKGVKVSAYDPVARETGRAALPAAVAHHESLELADAGHRCGGHRHLLG